MIIAIQFVSYWTACSHFNLTSDIVPVSNYDISSSYQTETINQAQDSAKRGRKDRQNWMFKCVTADKYCQNGQPLICLNIIYKKSKKQTQVNGGMNTELQMNLHIKMTYPCQTLKKVPEELHSTRHSVLPHKGHEKKPFFMYLIGNKIQGCTPTQFHTISQLWASQN